MRIKYSDADRQQAPVNSDVEFQKSDIDFLLNSQKADTVKLIAIVNKKDPQGTIAALIGVKAGEEMKGNNDEAALPCPPYCPD